MLSVELLSVPAAALIGLAVVAAATQSASFREGELHGRRAFVLENDQMRVSTLPGGGFIGEVRFKSDDPRKSINVMRVPHYQTIDPFTYDLARDGSRYGTGMQRRLMSGYMGHFLTFPHFAAASDAELAQDYGQHGEAIAVEWKIQKVDQVQDGVSLRYAADLPKTHFKVERTITLPADETVAYVDESVENMEVFGRPVQWTQHVTFGPPFVALNKNFVDAPIANVVTRNGQPAVGDPRVFSGTASTWLMDGSKPAVYFTMYNADYPVLIGYLFESASNRWVLDWQENQRMQETPWDRQVVARGVCIGDSIIGGLKNAVQRGSQLGMPVFSWIDAREKRTQRYAFFLAEIPLGFKGVSDLRIDNDRIVIVERETGTTRSIKAAALGAKLHF
jgi:hypothetical protein